MINAEAHECAEERMLLYGLTRAGRSVTIFSQKTDLPHLSPNSIAVSGYSKCADKAQVGEAGFDTFSLKPFNVNELVDLLDTISAHIGQPDGKDKNPPLLAIRKPCR